MSSLPGGIRPLARQIHSRDERMGTIMKNTTITCVECGAKDLGFDEIAEMISDTIGKAVCLDCADQQLLECE